jgi:uncharacterized protein (UPF0548 family)
MRTLGQLRIWCGDAAGYNRAITAQPTYAEVGVPVADPLPPGYGHIDECVRVGTAGNVERAREALLGWALQRRIGATVHPPDARPVLGATVLLRLRCGPLRITAPCRVTWTDDTADRAGFAYGALPGHPECGEEAFVLDRTGDGTWLSIRAFSRPDRWTPGPARRSPGWPSGDARGLSPCHTGHTAEREHLNGQ